MIIRVVWHKSIREYKLSEANMKRASMLPWHIWGVDIAKRTLGAGTGWGVSHVWRIKSTLLLLQNPINKLYYKSMY